LSNLKENLAALRIDQSERAQTGRTAIWVTLVVIVIALGAAGWYWTSRLQAASVRVASVTAKTSASGPGAVLNASGYVTARRRATVSSKVTGKVVEIFIEEGQSVRQGQVLARLDDSQARAALAFAQAQLTAARRGVAEDEAKLREAELNLQRRERLLTEGVVGRAEVDTAQADVDSTKARIDYARQQIAVAESQVQLRRTDLNDLVVRAPFSGVAISKDAQPGEMISPISAGGGFTRTGIGTIVDMSSLEIEVDVNESYINRVRPAQKVEAVLDAYPDWRIPAHVITTVPTADRQKATVRVRIGFDPSTGAGPPRAQSRGEQLDPRILPDMGVKVSFLREEQASTAPAAATSASRYEIPRTAVRTENDRTIVFVVRDDRVERRAVRTGLEQGETIEVLSGISTGEQVVVNPPATLKDGDRIRIEG
jgi:RND family efflux transporter MFP subunit